MDVLLPLRHSERRRQSVLPLLRSGSRGDADPESAGADRARARAGAAQGRIRDPRRARSGRYGHRLQGARETAGARGRHQGAAVLARVRQGIRRAVSTRSPHLGEARAPQHHPDLPGQQARAQQLDGRSDIYSLGVVAYQCLTGSVPFDGEDSFSIGYKHIMEEVPTPPLETYDQRTLFEVIRKMMAKVPDDRFQTSDDLVQALEAGGGFAAVGLATAPTRAIPSLAGARIAGAPTTPLPSTPMGARLAASVEHHRSVGAGIALWVVVVVVALGAPGLYAYKKGLLFFARAAVPDSVTATLRDTLAQRLLGDTGASGAAPDTAVTRPAGEATHPPVAPGTPGRLTLQGLPAGARVTLNGQPFRGQGDVPPGTYALAVRAAGFALYERPVVITPGAPLSVKVELEPAKVGGGESGTGPCDAPGPEYNHGKICFDTPPVPLSVTRIPIPADAPMLPRQAILLIHVSRDGATLEARVFGPSNLATFNDQAMDMARNLRWNPAQKNGEPVDAWVQWPFQPVRQ